MCLEQQEKAGEREGERDRETERERWRRRRKKERGQNLLGREGGEQVDAATVTVSYNSLLPTPLSHVQRERRASKLMLRWRETGKGEQKRQVEQREKHAHRHTDAQRRSPETRNTTS